MWDMHRLVLFCACSDNVNGCGDGKGRVQNSTRLEFQVLTPNESASLCKRFYLGRYGISSVGKITGKLCTRRKILGKARI